MTKRPWLRDTLAIMAEVLWSFAVVSILAALLASGDGPSFWALLAVALGGFYLTRLLEHIDISPGNLRTVGLVATVLGLYAILRLDYLGDFRLWDLSWLGKFAAHPDTAKVPPVLGSLAAVALWLRWVFRAQTPLTFDSVLLSFSTGFVLVALAALAEAAGDFGSAADVVVVPFFAIGLLTLAAFHQARIESASASLISRPWVWAVVATIGLLILLSAPAWFVGGVNVEPVFAPVGRVLLWVVDIFFRLLIFVLTPVIWALWQVMLALGDFLQAISPRRQELLDQLGQAGEEEGRGGGLPTPLLMLVRVASGFLLAAVVALLAWVVFRRLWRSRGPGDEMRESVWHEGSLVRDLGDLLGRLVSPWRWPRSQPGPELPADVLAVRRLYLDVLRRAGERGLERPPAKTPLEFAPQLDEQFSSAVPREVSRAFSRARYGLKAPPPDEVDRLRRRWEEVDK